MRLTNQKSGSIVPCPPTPFDPSILSYSQVWQSTYGSLEVWKCYELLNRMVAVVLISY